MKICKNCGYQAGEDKIRCPSCGYLFEEDMDNVLRQMRTNLNTYKQEISALPAAPAQQASAAQAPAAPAAGEQERFELLTEVAQLKGELKSLHSEIDRMRAGQVYPYAPQPAQPAAQGASAQGASFAQQGTQPLSQTGAAQSAQPAQTAQPVQPAYAAQPYIYMAPYPYAQPAFGAQPAAVKAGQDAKSLKKHRSANRITIAILCLLALAAAIGMFFLSWIKDGMAGFDAVAGLLSKESEGAVRLNAYLALVEALDVGGSETLTKILKPVCEYVIRYGIPVYGGLLVLSFPLLFSLGGRICFRGWHRFVAWLALLVNAAILGVFVLVSKFDSVTLYFLIGLCANAARCLFLIVYKKDKVHEGGLSN